MRPFIVLVGKSGAGKSTVARVLEKKYGLKEAKTYTTRPRRFADEDTHTFIKEQTFNTMVGNGDMVAISAYDGHLYGTSIAQILGTDVATWDVSGTTYYLARYGSIRPLLIVFLDAETNELTERMRKRGSSEAEIKSRLAYDASLDAGKRMADLYIRALTPEDAASTIYNEYERRKSH